MMAGSLQYRNFWKRSRVPFLSASIVFPFLGIFWPYPELKSRKDHCTFSRPGAPSSGFRTRPGTGFAREEPAGYFYQNSAGVAGAPLIFSRSLLKKCVRNCVFLISQMMDKSIVTAFSWPETLGSVLKPTISDLPMIRFVKYADLAK